MKIEVVELLKWGQFNGIIFTQVSLAISDKIVLKS